MRVWVTQQVEDRKRAENERRRAEKAYQDFVIARDKRAIELRSMENECRRRLNETTAQFNLALVKYREIRRPRNQLFEILAAILVLECGTSVTIFAVV